MARPLLRSHLLSVTESRLGQFRTILKTKQEFLQQFQPNREGIAAERNTDPTDEPQIVLDRELAIRVPDHKCRMLAAIRFALARKKDGTYGVCQSCESEIPEKRLAAVPWAAYCVECQERIDRAPERQEVPVVT